MAKGESLLKNNIVNAVRRRGIWATRLAASPFQKTGLPDIMGVVPELGGRALYVEAKMPGERPTRIQIAVLDELSRAGALAFVAESVQEVIERIEGEIKAWRR